MKKILIFTILIVFSAAQAKTKTPSFAALSAKAMKSSETKQVIYWKKLGEFTAAFEKLSEHPTKSAARDWFFNPAYAADGLWCVNNGYFAQVPACDKSNNWSFDVRTTDTFKLLAQQANVGDTCTGGQTPCSLIGGLTAAGGFECSNNSTQTCLNAASDDNMRRLAKTVQICAAGHKGVAIGTGANPHHISCDPFLQALRAQTQALDQSCAAAVAAVQNLCGKTRGQLEQVLKLPDNPTPAAPPATPAVSGDFKTDVLEIGDSHSTTCFGSELYKKIGAQTSPATGKPATVQLDAICATGATAWLGSLLSTTCGSQNCASGQGCATTGMGTTGTSQGIDGLLSSAKPRVTVVQLGTNMMGINWSGHGGNTEVIDNIIGKIQASGSKCIWVGPPQPAAKGLSDNHMKSFSDYLAFVATMKATVTKNNRCTFVDSSQYTNANDIRDAAYGVHYLCPQYTAWSDSVYNNTVRAAISDTTAGSEQAPATDQ